MFQVFFVVRNAFCEQHPLCTTSSGLALYVTHQMPHLIGLVSVIISVYSVKLQTFDKTNEHTVCMEYKTDKLIFLITHIK